MAPGPRGRRLGRLLIAVAVGIAATTIFLWLAAPQSIGPMFPIDRDWPVPSGLVIILLAATLLVTGLAWMIRIHRADPEPDQHAWRYRERD